MCDIKEDFYLCLSAPVNSTTLSEFSTKLANRVNLTPGYAFECALAKIIYPNIIANCHDGEISYYSFTLRKIEHTRIPLGFYSLPEDLISAWKSALQTDSKYYELSVANAKSKRFSLLLKSDETGVLPRIELSQNLTLLTGLPRTISNEGYSVSDKSWDVFGGSGILYIYTNFTENVLINTTSAPLLNVVKFELDTNKPYLEYEPQHRIYVPLENRTLGEVKIAIKTRDGKPFPFLSGELVIVIHIRPNAAVML